MEEPSIAACIASGYRCQLAEVNGTLAGFITVRDNCHLYHLFVSERFQRRGVAGRLWEAARAVSLQSGHPRVFTVNASCGAVGFYRKLGFVRHAEAVDREDITVVPMKLELSHSMSTSSPQHWDPARYAGHARFVSDLGLPVIELLSPRPGERVLDLGCGDGVLARSLMDRGCEVVGIDASPAMVAAARSQGVDARVADGQCLSFDESFDAVFSNAALHWMQHPVAVIDSVWRALKPGGRFVAEFGGEGNIAAIVAALESALAERELSIPSPWFFPSPETYRSLLEARGFEIGNISLFARPTELPGDVGHWLEIFAQPYLAAVAPSDRAAVVAEVVERLRPALRRGDGRWVADYVRLQFAATKPASAG